MADKRTVRIHDKDYETVASRVERFRADEDNDHFSIKTKIIEVTENRVIMRASILDKDNRVVATGHAEEVRAASTINKTSALENCETSAIGRALAAFGYLGTEFASADEVAQAISQQGTSKPPVSNARPATQPQRDGLIRKYKFSSQVPDMDNKEAEKNLIGYAGELGIDWSKLTHEDVQVLFENIQQDFIEETSPKDPPGTK